MNLLSIGAAYGVVVAVFQWGWGSKVIGLHDTVPISPFLPMIMFAALIMISVFASFLLAVEGTVAVAAPTVEDEDRELELV